MMKIFKNIFLLLLLAPVFGHSQILSKNLIGIWQSSGYMADGWNDAYQFFEDGNFKFNSNEMDGVRRLISYSGKWTLKNNQLKLSILQKEVIEGGKIEESDIFLNGELVGGDIKIIYLKNPQLQTLKISEFRYDEEHYHQMIRLGDKKFWKHREDPNDY